MTPPDDDDTVIEVDAWERGGGSRIAIVVRQRAADGRRSIEVRTTNRAGRPKTLAIFGFEVARFRSGFETASRVVRQVVEEP